jgi:hypothetical protein
VQIEAVVLEAIGEGPDDGLAGSALQAIDYVGEPDDPRHLMPMKRYAAALRQDKSWDTCLRPRAARQDEVPNWAKTLREEMPAMKIDSKFVPDLDTRVPPYCTETRPPDGGSRSYSTDAYCTEMPHLSALSITSPTPATAPPTSVLAAATSRKPDGTDVYGYVEALVPAGALVRVYNANRLGPDGKPLLLAQVRAGVEPPQKSNIRPRTHHSDAVPDALGAAAEHSHLTSVDCALPKDGWDPKEGVYVTTQAPNRPESAAVYARFELAGFATHRAARPFVKTDMLRIVDGELVVPPGAVPPDVKLQLYVGGEPVGAEHVLSERHDALLPLPCVDGRALELAVKNHGGSRLVRLTPQSSVPGAERYESWRNAIREAFLRPVNGGTVSFTLDDVPADFDLIVRNTSDGSLALLEAVGTSSVRVTLGGVRPGDAIVLQSRPVRLSEHDGTTTDYALNERYIAADAAASARLTAIERAIPGTAAEKTFAAELLASTSRFDALRTITKPFAMLCAVRGAQAARAVRYQFVDALRAHAKVLRDDEYEAFQAGIDAGLSYNGNYQPAPTHAVWCERTQQGGQWAGGVLVRGGWRGSYTPSAYTLHFGGFLSDLHVREDLRLGDFIR